MTQHYGGAPTSRCQTCGTNWPYAELFRTCPDCGHRTKGVRLHDEYEEVLTWQEGLARLRAANEEDDNPAPRKKGRLPTDREIAELRAGLDYWAHASGPDDPRLK